MAFYRFTATLDNQHARRLREVMRSAGTKTFGAFVRLVVDRFTIRPAALRNHTVDGAQVPVEWVENAYWRGWRDRGQHVEAEYARATMEREKAERLHAAAQEHLDEVNEQVEALNRDVQAYIAAWQQVGREQIICELLRSRRHGRLEDAVLATLGQMARTLFLDWVRRERSAPADALLEGAAVLVDLAAKACGNVPVTVGTIHGPDGRAVAVPPVVLGDLAGLLRLAAAAVRKNATPSDLPRLQPPAARCFQPIAPPRSVRMPPPLGAGH